MSDITRFSQSNPNAFRNPWVIGWLLLLSIVLLVNFVFIYTAFTTSPGLVEENYYQQGQDHEANIRKRREAELKLGWDLHLDMPQHPIMNEKILVSISAKDKQGVALERIKVMMHAYRPSDKEADFEVEMTEAGDGIYQAYSQFKLKGAWELQFTAIQGDDRLAMERRISVKGS